MSDTNEQWKPDGSGNCDICRRKTYCKTKCKNHKDFVRLQAMREVIKYARDSEMEVMFRSASDEG